MSSARLEKLHRMLQASPDDIELRYMLAMEYKATGEMEAALGEFDHCLRIRADYAPAYFQKGQTLVTLGHIPQARDVLKAGIDQAMRAGNHHTAEEMTQFLDSLS